MSDRTTRLDRLLRFDRSDFYASYLVIAFLAAAVPTYVLVMPLLTWIRDLPLRTQVQLEGGEPLPTELAAPAPGVQLTWDGATTARFEHLDAGTWLAFLAPGLVVTVATLITAWLLWRLLRSIEDGRPFVAGNLWRLRGIAAVLLLGPPLHLVAGAWSAGALTAAALEEAPTGFWFMLSPSFVLVMGVGMLLAAIAEAFRRGTALEHDVEGLV